MLGRLRAIKLGFKDETGAVTVDWVVLAGFVIATAVLVYPIVDSSVGSLAGQIESDLSSAATF